MRRSDWLIILQGIGVTLQVLNAGLGTVTHNLAVALIVGAVVAGYQTVLQHLGNQSAPDDVKPDIVPEMAKGSAAGK